MWRRPLNSVFNHYRLQKTRKVAQIGQIFEYRIGWQTSGWWKWIGRDYIMGETLHKVGIGKIMTERHWKRITIARWRINLQEQPIYLKTYSSNIHSILNYVSFPPRTGLKPQLTIRKLIKNLVLSPTLLQIYCIGLIGLVTHFLWVWAAICDSTIGAVYGKN